MSLKTERWTEVRLQSGTRQQGLFAARAVPEPGIVLLSESPRVSVRDEAPSRLMAMTRLVLRDPALAHEIVERHPAMQLPTIISDTLLPGHEQEDMQALATLRKEYPAERDPLPLYWALFRVNLNFTDPEGRVHSGYYPQISYLNHSCAPNCAIQRNHEVLSLVSLRPIAAGEQLCFCYMVTHPPFESLFPSVRREILRKTYGFRCRCDACH
jgi:hypothetical protein